MNMEKESKSVVESALHMMTSIFIIVLMAFAMLQVACAVVTLGWNIIEGLMVGVIGIGR